MAFIHKGIIIYTIAFLNIVNSSIIDVTRLGDINYDWESDIQPLLIDEVKSKYNLLV